MHKKIRPLLFDFIQKRIERASYFMKIEFVIRFSPDDPWAFFIKIRFYVLGENICELCCRKIITFANVAIFCLHRTYDFMNNIIHSKCLGCWSEVFLLFSFVPYVSRLLKILRYLIVKNYKFHAPLVASAYFHDIRTCMSHEVKQSWHYEVVESKRQRASQDQDCVCQIVEKHQEQSFPWSEQVLLSDWFE